MITHLVKHSEGRDVLIQCLQKWTEPTWYSNVLPKVESEIYWAEPIDSAYISYTFRIENVTCQECLKNEDCRAAKQKI
jgi:hypothetical protein